MLIPTKQEIEASGVVMIADMSEEIEKIFRQCEADHRDYHKLDRVFSEFSNVLRSLIPSGYIPLNDYSDHHSYFESRKDLYDCTNWHVDSNAKTAMLIAAWPDPTEILIGRTLKHGEITYDGCGSFNVNNLANQLIADGKAKVFTPKRGEVWFCPHGVIHRANPASYGKPHLVLRQWCK